MTDEALSYRSNSIDLIRLVAASQVLLGHGMKYLPGAQIDWLYYIIDVLPGVPLFFFLSGFLISESWSRKPIIRPYAQRRLRRIYPGLLATTALSIVAFSIFLRPEIANSPDEFVLWILCQLTSIQWNASFIKSYGIGYANVSLWTIPIEVAFYVMTPILLTVGKRLDRIALTISICMIISFIVFVFFDLLYSPSTPSQTQIRKVFLISPLASLTLFWMFGFGMLSNHYRAVLIPFLVRNTCALALLWGILVAVSLPFELPPFLKASGNDLGLFNFILTNALALSIAFRFPNLSDRLLFRTDLSYGLYIYHIPVINLIIATGGSARSGLLHAILISVGLAAFSWVFIESPCLGRRASLLAAAGLLRKRA